MRRSAAFAAAALTLAQAPAPPQTPEARGEALAREAARLDAGWRTERVRVEMTIETPGGRRETRVFRIARVEGGTEEGERSLVTLEEPARHRGLRVLTLAGRGGEPDAVWVRLPAHGRTRRIVGRKRSGRFLGSDLTYEDLGPRDPGRYTHRWLRDEPLDGAPCHVIEARPRDPDTGYDRLVLWREVGSLRLMRVDYHSRAGGALEKTARMGGYRQHAGGHQRPDTLTVVHAASGRRTVLRMRDRELGVPLADGAVSQRALTE